MKYVCIKEFILGSIAIFRIGCKIDNVEIICEEGFRDSKITFDINGLSFYLPRRKFLKHFISESKLREDRINKIMK